MENLPRITDSIRLPLSIPIPACLMDHHIEGHAVLPAVIAMELLGEKVNVFQPDMDIAVMNQARFDKFLYLHADQDRIEALVDIDLYENGSIRAGLMTKNPIKTSSMVRIKAHATVQYSCRKTSVSAVLPAFSGTPFSLGGITIAISADRVYRDLVPFGPAFRSIQDKLILSEQGAVARIKAPAASGNRMSVLLGSPFLLDGAYHCACVWGQRYAGMVAFPVGFENRTVWKPTRPETTYVCRVFPAENRTDLLVFDLCIVDENNVLFESSRGVCMKDVSAGRLKPPQWIEEA
jgi:hypothetical protein